MKHIRITKPVQGRSPLVHRAILAVSLAMRSLRTELKDLDATTPRAVSVQTALNALETAIGHVKLTDRFPRSPGQVVRLAPTKDQIRRELVKLEKPPPEKEPEKEEARIFHACRPCCDYLLDDYVKGQSMHELARKTGMSFTWVNRALHFHKAAVRPSGGDFWRYHIQVLQGVAKLAEAGKLNANEASVLEQCQACLMYSMFNHRCLNLQCAQYNPSFRGQS